MAEDTNVKEQKKKTDEEYLAEVSKVTQLMMFKTLQDAIKEGIPLSVIANGIRKGVDSFLQAMIDTTKDIISKYEAGEEATDKEETE